jgi:6-methylsalicylate decarboxylase
VKIDVHAHYWTADYIDLLVDFGKVDASAVRGIGGGGGAELDARLRLMERTGIEMQVLSACPQVLYGDDREKVDKAARFVNDLYAEEMVRALDELHMVGVAMTTTILGRALVEPDFAPICSELNNRSAVLYLHPAGNSACSSFISDFHLTWMVGAPVEDTISVMHLITNGIPTRYPKIRIINSHLGGALPMLLQRADDRYRWEAPGTPELPSAAARRMWYDTVGHGHVPALSCAIGSFGPDRLLLGTDFPYENGDQFLRAVDHINDHQIETSAARAILEKNASVLLGIR